MPNIIFFKLPSDFYQWLEAHHAETSELWLGFYKKKPKTNKKVSNAPNETEQVLGITYSEAVDAALCFGWIDGIRKNVDETSYTNRFTPRKPGSSIWSAVNLKRIAELIELGLVQPAGLAAYNGRNPAKSMQYSHEQDTTEIKLSPADLATFQDNALAWAFFQAQPASYQKTAVWWVISAKQEKTRLKRLATLIEDSQQGQRLAMFTRN